MPLNINVFKEPAGGEANPTFTSQLPPTETQRTPRFQTLPLPGGDYVNLPTVFGGQELPIEQALELVQRNGYVDPETGQRVQIFRDPQQAQAALRGAQAPQQQAPVTERPPPPVAIPDPAKAPKKDTRNWFERLADKVSPRLIPGIEKLSQNSILENARRYSPHTEAAANAMRQGVLLLSEFSDAAGVRDYQQGGTEFLNNMLAGEGPLLGPGVQWLGGAIDMAMPIIGGIGGAARRAVEPFYSNAQKAVIESKFEKGTAEQYLALPGMKKDEIEATGLKEFLEGKGDRDLFNPKGTVTKDEVLDYLDQNEVKLGEVRKGGGTSEADIDMMREHELESTVEEFDIVSSEDGEGFVIELYGDAGSSEVVYDSFGEAEEALENQIRGSIDQMSDAELIERSASPDSPTQHSEWQLPGGENYRETLITLPERGPRGIPAGYEVTNFGPNNFGLTEPDGTFIASGYQTQEQLVADLPRILETRGTPRPDAFTGGHFNEPNVVVHVRHNERVDADGNKVLFIEEIQSDWHQQGRKKGYAGDFSALETQILTAAKESGADMDEVHWAIDQLKKEPMMDNNPDAERAWSVVMHAADDPITAGTLDVNAFHDISDRGVPDAPFKKTWHELGLKRMIRHAAENDFDQVAWTTGKQQVDRYESALRSRVDEIHWTKTDEGIHIQGYKTGPVRSAQRHIPDRSGRQKVVDTTEKEDALSDALGKAMAQDIIGDSAQTGVIKGDNIRIDDTGMAGFYDRILPRAANKLGKKFGAKVGETKIDVALPGIEKPEYRVHNPDGTFFDTSARGADQARLGDPTARIEQLTKSQLIEGATAHTLKITPELKKEVLEKGLPLFGVGAGALLLNELDISPPGILLQLPPEES